MLFVRVFDAKLLFSLKCKTLVVTVACTISTKINLFEYSTHFLSIELCAFQYTCIWQVSVKFWGSADRKPHMWYAGGELKVNTPTSIRATLVVTIPPFRLHAHLNPNWGFLTHNPLFKWLLFITKMTIVPMDTTCTWINKQMWYVQCVSCNIYNVCFIFPQSERIHVDGACHWCRFLHSSFVIGEWSDRVNQIDWLICNHNLNKGWVILKGLCTFYK